MRTLYPRFYPRMIDILRTIGGSDLAMMLRQADLQGPLAGRLAPYFQGVNTSAEEHVQLIRLAWDMVGDSFGSRQLLYERFFSVRYAIWRAGISPMTRPPVKHSCSVCSTRPKPIYS